MAAKQQQQAAEAQEERFASVLDKPLEDAERPPPFPSGTYTLTVIGKDLGPSGQNNNIRLRLRTRASDYDSDVNEGELPDNWQTRVINHDFWLTNDALYRFREFCEATGLAMNGRTTREVIADLEGHVYKATVESEPSRRDPSEFYTNINPPYAAL